MGADRSYFICATVRSGSTWLCELLTRTAVAGHPNEWFLPQSALFARYAFGVQASDDDPRYISELKSKVVSANGVFGVKLMWPQMQQIMDGIFPWLDQPLRSPFRSCGIFPGLRYIHISRDDDIRQAISFMLATRTNEWHRVTEEPSDEIAAKSWVSLASNHEHFRRFFLAGKAMPRWSVEQIKSELSDPVRNAQIMSEIGMYREMIRTHECAWLDFFSREGVCPFKIRYEDLSSYPTCVLAEVLRFLDIPADNLASVSKVNLTPLADDRNKLLARAYRAHCRL